MCPRLCYHAAVLCIATLPSLAAATRQDQLASTCRGGPGWRVCLLPACGVAAAAFADARAIGASIPPAAVAATFSAAICAAVACAFAASDSRVDDRDSR